MNLLQKLSKIVSYTFNGFLLILLPIIFAFAILPIPLLYKILFPSLYALITLVPFLVLKKLGKVSDLEFSNREERPLYFTIASIGYLLLFIASAFLKNIDIMHVTLAVFAVTCIFTIVNLYWKMSGHMTFSTIAFITLIYLFPSTKLLFLVFILTPIIAASRVILKKHTIMQVIAGVLTSVAICILIFWVL